MKKKLLLTALVVLVTSLAFGQIIIPKVNKAFVTSKANMQLKGLEQNDYQRNLGFSILGQKAFTQTLNMKAASAKQKLDSTVERSWKVNVNDWVKSSKDEYTYDANGKWIVGLYHKWNDTTKVWVRDTKDEYTYNANGKWETNINSDWDSISNAWVKSSRQVFTYDGSGYNTQILVYEWKTSPDVWIESLKYDFTYVNGNCSLFVISKWNVDTNKWDPEMKYEYTYDSNGHNTQFIAYSMNKDMGDWVTAMKFDFTYNDSGKMTTAIYSMPYASEWITYMKYELTYDANGRLGTEIFSQWDFISNQLVFNSKYEYGYDTNGNNTTYLTSKWNVTASNWDLYSNETSTYNTSYNFSDLIFPSGYSMVSIAYLPSAGDIHNMPVEDIEYLRDNTNSVWNNNTKTNYYFSANIGTGINELKVDELNEFIVYPNPVSDGFRLNTSEKNVRISIYDLSGSLLLTKQISGNEYINISTLPQGMYMVRATTEKGIVTKKIVKK